MNIAEINPYIRVAMNSVLAANWVLSRRVIYDYELVYIDEGAFTLSYDDVEYNIKKGDFFLIRPGIPHSFRMGDSDLSQPHIHFDMVYESGSGNVPVSYKDKEHMEKDELKLIREDVFAAYPKTPLVRFSDKKRALRLFFSVVSKGTVATDPLSQKADMLKLLSMLIKDNYPESLSATATNGIEKHIKDFIDSEQGFSVSLDELEKQFCYDKFYLEKCFKRTYGISIMAYRNKVRMRAAKELLKKNSLTSVSEMLGYSSIYTFSRAFKQYYGISPSFSKKDGNEKD